MPHIEITMYPGRSDDIKRRLAEKLRKAAAEELKLDEKFVTVSVRDIDRDKWNEHLSSFSPSERFTGDF